MSKPFAWGCAFPVLTVFGLFLAVIVVGKVPGFPSHATLEELLLICLWTAAAVTSVYSRSPRATPQQENRGWLVGLAPWPVYWLLGALGYIL